MKKGIAWACVVIGILALAWYLFYLRPALIFLHQVQNHVRCTAAEYWVKQQHTQTGSYPNVLRPDLVTDAWGHPIQYTRLPDGYLIVSFGRDGKPDGSDYLALRSAGDHPAGDSICGHPDADEVLSDKGWHRLCGK
jgi:hypothetical protein